MLDYSEFLHAVQCLREDRDFFKTGVLVVEFKQVSDTAIVVSANPMRVYLFNPKRDNDNHL